MCIVVYYAVLRRKNMYSQNFKTGCQNSYVPLLPTCFLNNLYIYNKKEFVFKYKIKVRIPIQNFTMTISND